MKRILFIISLFAAVAADAQVKQQMGTYGIRARRIQADSAFKVSTFQVGIKDAYAGFDTAQLYYSKADSTLKVHTGTQWIDAVRGGGSGTVTSVGLSMPSAFTVGGSPVTGAGTLAVTGAGTTAQYIRGDGSLATLPSNTDSLFGVHDNLATQNRAFRLPSDWYYSIYNHPTNPFLGGRFSMFSGASVDSSLQFEMYTGVEGSERAQTFLDMSRFGAIIEYGADDGAGNFRVSSMQVDPDFVGWDYHVDPDGGVGDLTLSKDYFRPSHNRRITFNINNGGTVGNSYLDLDFVNHYNRLGDVSTQSYFESRVDSLTLRLKSTASKLLIPNTTPGSGSDSILVITSADQVKAIAQSSLVTTSLPISSLTPSLVPNTITVGHPQTWNYNSTTTGVGHSFASNSLTTGSVVDITATSSFLGGTGVSVNMNNSDPSGSQTTYAGKFVAGTAGTGHTNVAGYFSATSGFQYAIIVPSGGGSVGIGTTTPTATFHSVGTAKFDLGSDATGDIFYRNSSGFLTRLGVGSNGDVLTLASGLPSWAAPLVTPTNTVTLTNKRWTARVGSTTSSATPTINTDDVDIYKLTAQATDITSFTTNLSGTPVDGDILEIQITGTAARGITWGASFVSSTVTLPATTVTTATLTIILQYYTTSSYGNNKWVCVNYY